MESFNIRVFNMSRHFIRHPLEKNSIGHNYNAFISILFLHVLHVYVKNVHVFWNLNIYVSQGLGIYNTLLLPCDRATQ